MKAFLVAGTSSGVGKTTVTLALMAAFRARGLMIQPFKCGPDFLDTGHHTRVCGRPSRNLDTWMLNPEQNRESFSLACAGADLAIVEGMMGLFDGASGKSEAGSSAEIAKLLGIPVVLVLDASSSARSLAAVVRGFEVFDPDLHLAGVILNRVAGAAHYRLLEDAIGSTCKSAILGWLPAESSIAIPERHLGLRSAIEQTDAEERIQTLVALAEQQLDLPQLIEVARESHPAMPSPQRMAPIGDDVSRVRVGVARDAAFQFYYEDNLELLRECGAEIVSFSPMSDASLPEDLDGLYLGGGYPELYAEQLSRNRRLLEDIREFARRNRPIYAECGGMLYLAQELQTGKGRRFPMTGILPMRVEMTEGLVHFGYAQVEFTRDCVLGKQGTVARGHSFHFSRILPEENLQTAYRVNYVLSGHSAAEGYRKGSVLASYLHLHFRGNRTLPESLVRCMRRP